VEIVIRYPDPAPAEVLTAITDLMARLGPGASIETDAEWTVDRAVKLLRDTNARTVLLVEAAVEGDGWVDGPAFREKWGETAFRGPTQSITKAIKRGAEQGHWSANIAPPFTPTTPDKSGWSKTGGYYLEDGLVPIFRDALRVLKEKGSQP
jgi:hypothetical protein